MFFTAFDLTKCDFPINFFLFYSDPIDSNPMPALAPDRFYGILFSSQTLQGETAMAKDKDKGKEKGNKPKLSVKEKKLKKKEKLNKKASMA